MLCIVYIVYFYIYNISEYCMYCIFLISTFSKSEEIRQSVSYFNFENTVPIPPSEKSSLISRFVRYVRIPLFAGQSPLEIYFVPELNSTSPSTGELGELVENDELTKETDDDEDAVEDILYMRGASFTIHLDPPPENSTTNSTKITEETSAPLDRVEVRATSQVSN